MLVTETQVRVRYAETDKMGIVYHGNYAIYYEAGRTEALRQIGITYKSLEDNGVMMPLVNMSSKFHWPATYDEVLTIRTFMEEITGARVNIRYEIYNGEQQLINSAETTLVFLDMQTRRPTRCPQALIDKMKPYFK
jgi:acyl-CoA thioester hydrolase